MKVLVADDDATSRLLLKSIVTRLGHECVVTEDGDSAWAHLHEHPVDVLLTDWMMPGLEGTELCRRLRAAPSAIYTYIVLVTSLSDASEVLAGMQAGADDYLAKPVEPFQVEARLVAAERVTHLHSQIRAYRDRLEMANLELLDQSHTDALTGLGNRRLMERDLAGALAYAERHDTGFGVVLFDVDRFKAFNDRYGHPGGDDALRQTARAIAGVCRAEDTAYRYGGEEFLVLLPGQDGGNSMMAATRMRLAVEALGIPHADSPHGVVTVSGGVAGWSDTTTPTLSALLDAADHALYQAKSGGRNLVTDGRHPAPTAER